MRNQRHKEQGVALVVTVIVVAMLAVVGVALMQSVSQDRSSSRSVANYMRAQLAADAGVAMAGRQLARQMTNDAFIVVANNTNQLFVGDGKGQSGGNFSYTPIFSTESNPATTPSPQITNGMPSNSAGGTNFAITNIPGLADITNTSPQVSWVYLTNSDGKTNARFAFWAEDLGGKVDLSVAGTNRTDPVAKRPTGTNPAELALWGMDKRANSAAAATGIGDLLVTNRGMILTTATARLIDNSITNKAQMYELAANLRHDTNEPEIIPYGFGYVDEGKPKYDLNTLISQAGVAKIAKIINDNLPNFKNRSGAMNGTAYINNLAANIIDYADTDDTPTVDTAANPTYLGIENIPWPNELFDQLKFTGVSADGSKIEAELRDWIEVWNMGNKPTAANHVISVDNNYDMVLTFSNTVSSDTFQANLKAANFDSGSLGKREFAISALQPNEYKVVPSSSTPAVRSLSWPIPIIPTDPTAQKAWKIMIRSNDETKNMSYKAYSGGVLIQQSKGGRWPRYLANTLSLNPAPTTPNAFIFANPIGFASQTGSSSSSAKPAHSGGDPRAQLFLSDPLRSQNYTNGYSSPGGRNWESANIGTYPESEVNPGMYWPDGGHVTGADRGGLPTSYTQTPDSSTFARAAQTNNFVMWRNDTGQFTNITELGNIYDPMQWADQTGSDVSGQPGLWTNLTAAASPDASFGGRNTLRIGRWEFTRFNTNGLRAAQLLDLFAVGETNAAGTIVHSTAGRINLNTARAYPSGSSKAIYALAMGVNIVNDPFLRPDIYPLGADTNRGVIQVTRGVNFFKSSRPFFSPAEMASIAYNTNSSTWPANSVFGNPEHMGNLDQNQTDGKPNPNRYWNDAAAEEWFSKILGLTTVRSRNFLVYAVGEALDPSNPSNALSRFQSATQIYIAPMRDNKGTTTNSQVEVLQRWSF